MCAQILDSEEKRPLVGVAAHSDRGLIQHTERDLVGASSHRNRELAFARLERQLPTISSISSNHEIAANPGWNAWSGNERPAQHRHSVAFSQQAHPRLSIPHPKKRSAVQ